jgi:hypothetical protein
MTINIERQQRLRLRNVFLSLRANKHMPIQMPSTNTRTSSIVFSAMEAFSAGPYLLTVDVLKVVPSVRGVLALLVLGAGPFNSNLA